MHLPVELCWDTYMPPILYDNTYVCTSKKWQCAALDVPEDAAVGVRSVLKFAFRRDGAALLRESQQREQGSLCAWCLFIHCFHTSKHNVSENRVCVCLGVLAQVYLQWERNVLFGVYFPFWAQG